jgi:hypothetical protein
MALQHNASMTTTNDRTATRPGWLDHLEDLLRPAIEEWAAGRTKVETARAMSAAGLRDAGVIA